MAIERECKIPVPDPARTLARLRAAGACEAGCHVEHNWVFDTRAQTLRQQDMLLRLRVLDDEDGGVLTVKKAALPGAFKTREELEVTVDDAATLRTALEALGYAVLWYYEKVRASWHHRGSHVALDRLPELGHFLEVEATSDETIAAVLKDLGLDPAAHISSNYLALFAAHCQGRAEPLHAMRFANGDREILP